MCCFTVVTPLGLVARLFAPTVRVSQTNIFARMVAPGAQALAYGMNLSSKDEIAMVLPLPVVPGSGEDAVKFVDLSAHPHMFTDFRHLFEMMLSAKKGGMSLRLLPRAKTLVVHDIGSFVASYVPTRDDFARLDPRFRIPEVLFDAVPRYRDYGFAVFQLKPGNVTVHPMGLVFPTRDQRLYFPTVHLHDGRFHARAKFDHALYYQLPRVTEVSASVYGGEPRSEITSFVKPHTSYAELVDQQLPMLRQILRGKLANDDTWVS
jgi:hypothetical protein